MASRHMAPASRDARQCAPVAPEGASDAKPISALKILLFLGMTTLMLLVAACGQQAGPGAAPGPTVTPAPRPETGVVWAWGSNLSGELGNATITSSTTPVRTSLPAGVRISAVSAADHHVLALASDGSVYAWGSNWAGELGIGTVSAPEQPVTSPVRVHLPAGAKFTAIAAGWNHSLALASDGTLYAWGSNSLGQLGNGIIAQTDAELNVSTPVRVVLPTGIKVKAIAAGLDHSLALMVDGTLYAWGSDQFGELGIGKGWTQAPNPVPQRVHLPAGMKTASIVAGAWLSLALGTDGTLYGWGAVGQQIVGTPDSTSPVPLNPPPGILPAGVKITAIASGTFHILMLASDGAVYAWGSNPDGQLGNGTTSSTISMARSGLPVGVKATAIVASGGYSLALASDGSVYAWGSNEYGQLGNGTTVRSLTPALVHLPANSIVIAITGGQYFAIVLVRA